MAQYTHLSLSDLNTIINEYDIKDVINFNPISGGNANSSFLLKTPSQEYVLTILEEMNIKQAQELGLLLQYLQKNKIYTSKVCLTNSGEIISQFKSKPVLLKYWISGSIEEDMSGSILEEIGSVLAKLHQIPVPDFLTKEHAYTVQTFSSIINNEIDLEYENWLKNQIGIINNNLSNKLPKGMIHGDLFYDNLIIETGKYKAIIDFEEACFYYLIFDIGMSILGLCFDKGFINLAKVRAFLSGYQSLRPLINEEKEKIKFFVEYAATATSIWRYWKYNIDVPNKNLKNKHWEMVAIAKQLSSMDNSSFNL